MKRFKYNFVYTILFSLSIISCSKVIEVKIDPIRQKLVNGSSVKLNAMVKVNDEIDTSLIWSILDPTVEGTSISKHGLLTISTNEKANSIRVKVFSLLDTSKSAILNLNISKLNSGLVGYWPFNGNANDESGNNNNGIVHGPTLTTDRFGNSNKAYDFNLNHITIPGEKFDFSNELSVNVWYKISSKTHSGTESMFFVSKHTNSSLKGSSFCLYNNSNCGPVVYVTQANSLVKTVKNVSFCDTSNWHMLTMVVSGNELKMYLDASYYSKTDLNSPIQKSNVPLIFGGASVLSNQNITIPRMIGKLDDIAIWNRKLTQEEISDLYNSSVLF